MSGHRPGVWGLEAVVVRQEGPPQGQHSPAPGWSAWRPAQGCPGHRKKLLNSFFDHPRLPFVQLCCPFKDMQGPFFNISLTLFSILKHTTWDKNCKKDRRPRDACIECNSRKDLAKVSNVRLKFRKRPTAWFAVIKKGTSWTTVEVFLHLSIAKLKPVPCRMVSLQVTWKGGEQTRQT